MREDYKYKISIYGTIKEINFAKTILEKLNLSGSESDDRLIIQNSIDTYKIKAHILYDGNNVYSYNKIIRDFKKALKSKPSEISEYGSGDWDMTDALYKFFSLVCGSIAHYNKYGWIGTYPTKDDLKRFCKCNEFGQDIVKHQPNWATDRIKITKAMLNIIGD